MGQIITLRGHGGENRSRRRSCLTNGPSMFRQHGSRAWDRLKNRQDRLSPEDRAYIARQIDRNIANLKAKPGQLAALAGFQNGTKELHDLRLPVNASEARVRELTAYPQKYVGLISAIQIISGESIYRLVDQLTYGSSIHPVNAENLSEAERVHAALQAIVNKIDTEFNLFDKFIKTAEVKEEQLIAGGMKNWPFYDYYEDELDFHAPILADLELPKKALKAWGFTDPSDLNQKLEDLNFDHVHPDDQSWIEGKIKEKKKKRQEHFEKIGRKYAFWELGTFTDDYPQTCFDRQDAIRYLPHIHLGQLTSFRDWVDSEYLANKKVFERQVADARKAMLSNSMVPFQIICDEDNGEPVVEINEEINDDYDWDHAWMMIYPDADLTGLIPVIVIPQAERGVFTIPLDTRNLLYLKKELDYVSTEGMSGYDRIKQLLGYGGGDNLIEQEFRRTAPFVDFNPFLSEWRSTKENDDEFSAYLNSFLTKGGDADEN